MFVAGLQRREPRNSTGAGQSGATRWTSLPLPVAVWLELTTGKPKAGGMQKRKRSRGY